MSHSVKLPLWSHAGYLTDKGFSQTIVKLMIAEGWTWCLGGFRNIPEYRTFFAEYK